jgi:signal transduction histidine kinase
MSPRRSIATRLALGYGALLTGIIVLASLVFYLETVVVLERNVDGKIVSISNRLFDLRGNDRDRDLASEIDRLLRDGIESDTEIFLLASAGDRRLAGNLSQWPRAAQDGELFTAQVIRDGQSSSARLFVRTLPDGSRLFVGRDLHDIDEIRGLVWRALGVAAIVSLLFVVGGTMFFRAQIERRIGQIRRTALEIEAGDLSRRVPVSSDDEFGRLNADINRMLDRIQHLMEGVRHVSNAIAHDLRTPLSRIRNGLDDALRHGRSQAGLETAARDAMAAIDEVNVVFDKLLQIAQAESGVRGQSFEPVDLSSIVHDVIELYDAAAEECGAELSCAVSGAVPAFGDRDLLANALANLVDNALKHGGPHARVQVDAKTEERGPVITVRDNGVGIPRSELPNVVERFYRVDRSRHRPGNGLGLSIVTATAALHGGSLELEDGRPGLLARIVLPAHSGAGERDSPAPFTGPSTVTPKLSNL